MEPPGLEPPHDLAASEAARKELPPGNDAMLLLRKRGEQCVRRASVQFGTYVVLKCTLARHTPSLAREMRPRGRGL